MELAFQCIYNNTGERLRRYGFLTLWLLPLREGNYWIIKSQLIKRP